MPNPFDTDVTFTFAEGSTGLATTFSVSVYDLSGHQVWSDEVANTDEVVWDGTDDTGAALANGAYIFVAMATDGTDTFTSKGTVFINR
jgi:flagellar hook assembly protein FlgD